MDTRLVYSLIAAGAIPVTANATVNAYVGTDTYSVGGTTQTVNVGRLVKGIYKLTSNTVTYISTGTLQYRIMVDGSAQGGWTNVSSGSAINREFELTKESNVRIQLRRNGGLIFPISIGNIQVEALFDFTKLAEELTKEINHLNAELKAYSFTDGKNDFQVKAAEYQVAATKIATAEGTDGYEVFKKYQLGEYDYQNPVGGPLFDAILQDRKDAKQSEQDFLDGDGKDDKFIANKTKYETVVPQNLKEDGSGNPTDLAKKYDAAVAAYDKLASEEGLDGTGDIAKAAQTAISEFIAAMDEVDVTADANQTAYMDLMAEYNAAKAYADKALNRVDGDVLDGARYADLKAAGKAEADAGPRANLKAAKQAVEDAYKAGTCVEDQEALSNQIALAKQSATALATKYDELKEKLDAAYETYDDSKADADQVLTADVRAIDPNDFDLTKEIAAVDDAVKALLDKIEANDNSVEGINSLANLSADTKKIADAIAALEAKLAIYSDYKEMQDDVNALYGGNDDLWSSTLAAVKEYAAEKKLNETDYNIETLWNAAKTAVQSKTSQLNGKITQNKYDASNFKTDKLKDKYTTALAAIQTEIENFETNAKAAIDIYAPVSADAAEANTLYDEVKAAVENLDVYEEAVTDNARTPYKTTLAALKEKIEAAEAILQGSLAATAEKDPVKNGKANEANHLGYLNSNGLTADALTETVSTLKAMKENWEKDQEAWEAQRDAQAMANMQENIEALAATYVTQITEAQEGTDFGPLAEELAAEVKKVTDAIQAIVDKGGEDIVALTKNFEDLQKMADEGGELDVLLDVTIPAIEAKLAYYTATMEAFKDIDFEAIAKAVAEADPDIDIYTNKLAELKAGYEALEEEINAADWSKKPADSKTALLKKINDKKAEINALAGLATDNLAAYNDAKKAYNDEEADPATGAIPEYEAAKENILTNYPSSANEEQINELDLYKDKFDTLLEEAEASYKAGKAKADDYKTQINNLIQEMKGKVAQWTDEVNYNVQVEKDNQKVYNEDIPAAKKAAEAAYTNAAEAIKAYLSLTSTELLAAKNQADAELNALNELLYTFNEDLAAIQQDADKAFLATVSPAQFDPEGEFVAAFKAKEEAVNVALQTFLDKMKETVEANVNASVEAYDSAISASKKTAKKYTDKKGKELADKNITNAYKKVDETLANIKDLWESFDGTDVAELDEALFAAEQEETGINDQLPAIENGLAKTAIQTLVNAVNRSYLEESDQETYDNIKAEYATGYNAKDNFDSYKSTLLALKATADQNKQDNANIQKAITAIANAQSTLDAAYGTLDEFAAGSQLKAQLDAIQAQLDAYDEITLDNYQAAIDAATAAQAATTKVVTEDLYKAELPILNDLIAEAKKQYPAYAESAADEGAEAKKTIEDAEAAIEDFEKAIANATTAAKKSQAYQNALNAIKGASGVEKKLTNLIALMKDANGTGGDDAALFEQLTEEVNALAYDLSGYDAEVQNELAKEAAAIDQAIVAAKAYVAAHETDIAAYEDNVKSQIADIQKAIEALYKQADELQQNSDTEALADIDAIYTQAEAIYNDVQEQYNALADLLNEFGVANNYKNKMAQLQNLIDAAVETIASDKTEAAGLETIADKQAAANATLKEAQKQADAISLDLSEIYAKEMQAYTDSNENELQDALDALVDSYDASKYTSGDQQKIEDALDDIQAAIDDYADNVNAAIQTAQPESAAEIKQIFAEEKEKIETLIADAKQQLKDLEFTEDVRGHVTGGDEITSDDLMELADIILEGQEAEADLERCDVNSDGEIDVTDLVWLRYYLVHGYWPNEEQKVQHAPAIGGPNSIAMKVVSKTNGITRVAVNLDNTTTFQAFQLNMQLPEGAKVVGKSFGERVQGAILMSSKAAEGDVRFVALSKAKNTFAGNEGTVVYFDIENLNGEIVLSKAIFTDVDFNGIDLTNSSTTGIKETITNAIQNAGQKIYNLSGKVMNGLKKGVNILRGEDGSTKKVVVK